MKNNQILMLLIVCLISCLYGGTDGTIRGKITDSDGNALPGAQMYIRESGQDAIISGTIAESDGSYILLNVQVGSYDITCTMIGYRQEIRKSVDVIMDKTLWINFRLPLAAVEGEEVFVYGEKELVEIGSTSKKITIGKEAIEALPLRDITELYSLQSGVVKVVSRNQGIPDHEERGLEEVHVRGGRSGEIAYMIDGLYIRNPIYGGIGNGTRLNLFAVKEFDWQPGGFNAEYGDAMSAVSNMHTMLGGRNLEYKFKYETSLVGAALEEGGYDDLRGYNDYNFGFGGGLGGKFNYWLSGQFTDHRSYRVYKFDDKIYQHGEGDPYNYQPINEDYHSQNYSDYLQPWDTQSGFRGFGFDRTNDVFGKFAYKFTNRFRVDVSYWQVAAHRKGFASKYLYWNDGQNELFRDTYRGTIQLNHSITSKTFYTIRYSRFIQDQFQGVRWKDSDSDGYPDWYEWRHPAGDYFSEHIEPTSDPYNPFIVPYTVSDNGDTVYYTMRDEQTGWFPGATPGTWNWAIAEQFNDVNNNKIYDEGIDSFEDLDGDGVWDGPELIEECIWRDNSYWLTPDMYESFLDFVDYRKIYHEFEQDPYWAFYGGFDPQFGINPSGAEYNIGVNAPNYFLPFQGYGWNENRIFGGSDRFYSTSRALTQEIRFDITSQLTNKWKIRTGIDLKSHKLNFNEIKFRWEDEKPPIQQSFAEYWIDSGPDGLFPGNTGNGMWDFGEEKLWDLNNNGDSTDVVNGEYEFIDKEVFPDFGEGNGKWDPGEYFDDANNNGEWDDFREPIELSVYIQNTFEVPWMVVNAGIRIDGVNYNTSLWSDPLGNPSPQIPWYYGDIGKDGVPDTQDPGENDNIWDGWTDENGNEVWDQGEGEPEGTNPGLQNQKTFIIPAQWYYRVSPRLGISHVITSQATFTFNYGLYYQTPIYQNVYLNTNRLTNPQEYFEETEGFLGNATMTATKTESYEFAFNIQMNRFWAFSLGGWVKDMDQLITSRFVRSGVYKYYVFDNGDYGSAKGIDFTLRNRGMVFNTTIQYTLSIAKANSPYDWATLGLPALDAPSQESLMSFDRTHDFTISLYTGKSVLPFGIVAGLTGFYESGTPYTPYKQLLSIYDTPEVDSKNKNSVRSPSFKMINLNLSKYVKFGKVKMTVGMNIFNLFNLENAIDIWPTTGEPDNPGQYLTDNIGVPLGPEGVPVEGRAKSGSYYDFPWYKASPRQINFYVQTSFK